MRKFLSVFLLLVVICAGATFTACDDGTPQSTVTENGVTYSLQDDNTYAVTAFSGTATEVTIKDSISNLAVTSVADEAFNYKKTIKKVTLPSSVTTLGSSAFMNCSELFSVNLGSVQVIGNSAFSGCAKLTSVSLDSATNIGSNVFQGCRALRKAVIPATVKNIAKGTFTNCATLSEVEFKGDIETIGVDAFSGCTVIQTINLDKVKYFKKNAFNACSSIKTLVLTNAIEIDDMAFQACDGIETITFGANCRYINKNAFNKCKSVQSIVMVDPVGWTSVGTCAACGITEWASSLQASSWANPANNVKEVVLSDWSRTPYYLCKQSWITENRPNGWNKQPGC